MIRQRKGGGSKVVSCPRQCRLYLKMEICKWTANSKHQTVARAGRQCKVSGQCPLTRLPPQHHPWSSGVCLPGFLSVLLLFLSLRPISPFIGISSKEQGPQRGRKGAGWGRGCRRELSSAACTSDANRPSPSSEWPDRATQCDECQCWQHRTD